jgi:hypothetical protein
MKDFKRIYLFKIDQSIKKLTRKKLVKMMIDLEPLWGVGISTLTGMATESLIEIYRDKFPSDHFVTMDILTENVSDPMISNCQVFIMEKHTLRLINKDGLIDIMFDLEPLFGIGLVNMRAMPFHELIKLYKSKVPEAKLVSLSSL